MNTTVSNQIIEVLNALCDKFGIAIDWTSQNELVVTCKVGPDEYKKNYIYLNEYTMYVVEDITGTHTDPYHYKLYFHTDILPDVEVKP